MTIIAQEQVEVHYAPRQNRERRLALTNYFGALSSIIYGAIWPAIVTLYLNGFADTYNRFLPQGSIQDNLVGIVFKMPSEAVGTVTETILPEKLERTLGIPTYFFLWGAAGHTIQTSTRRIKNGRTKRKSKNDSRLA